MNNPKMNDLARLSSVIVPLESDDPTKTVMAWRFGWNDNVSGNEDVISTPVHIKIKIYVDTDERSVVEVFQFSTVDNPCSPAGIVEFMERIFAGAATDPFSLLSILSIEVHPERDDDGNMLGIIIKHSSRLKYPEIQFKSSIEWLDDGTVYTIEGKRLCVGDFIMFKRVSGDKTWTAGRVASISSESLLVVLAYDTNEPAEHLVISEDPDFEFIQRVPDDLTGFVFSMMRCGVVPNFKHLGNCRHSVVLRALRFETNDN